jgi:hypothetical protein
MSKPAAFRAVYSDFKLVKTRGVIQVIFELPVEQSDAAYEVLGGMPVAGKERWFGIAAIKSEAEVMSTEPESNSTKPATRPDQEPPRPDLAKRAFRDLQPAQQAGIRCGEPSFQLFLTELYKDDFHEAAGDRAECIRLICGVSSRAELDTNHKARVIWHQLNDRYEAWMRLCA